jgi:hypothetical protein
VGQSIRPASCLLLNRGEQGNRFGNRLVNGDVMCCRTAEELSARTETARISRDSLPQTVLCIRSM